MTYETKEVMYWIERVRINQRKKLYVINFKMWGDLLGVSCTGIFVNFKYMFVYYLWSIAMLLICLMWLIWCWYQVKDLTRGQQHINKQLDIVNVSIRERMVENQRTNGTHFWSIDSIANMENFYTVTTVGIGLLSLGFIIGVAGVKAYQKSRHWINPSRIGNVSFLSTCITPP